MVAKKTIAKVHISHPGLLVSVLQLIFHSPGAGILNLQVLVCRTFKEQLDHYHSRLDPVLWASAPGCVCCPVELAGSCFHVIQNRMLSQMVKSVLRSTQTMKKSTHLLSIFSYLAFRENFSWLPRIYFSM